ncbi:MAG: protein kinase [Deltaproteobacteria bacterium]|nr:protein kinase [Deltaproteobacteria bacterium]
MLERGQRVLDRYVVERTLGAGGMGAVYVGRHDRLGFAVAIKLLLDAQDAGLKERFQREAELMGKVRHPNVVSVLDYGFLESGYPCIVMDFVEGEPLDRRLSHLSGVPWSTACDWMAGVLGGLGAMHAEGVLHRDLKPANIVLAKGQPEYAKIIDFGIAKDPKDSTKRLTLTGGIIGTPAYMSPEQLLGGELDERSDLYAAGLILWEMLAGTTLTKGNDVSAVVERLRTAPDPPRAPGGLPAVPRVVQDLVLAALAVQPEKRPRTAAEFVDRLRKAVIAASVVAPSSGSPSTRIPAPRVPGKPPAAHEGAPPPLAVPAAGATRVSAPRNAPTAPDESPATRVRPRALEATGAAADGATRLVAHRPGGEPFPESEAGALAPLSVIDGLPSTFVEDEPEDLRYLVAARLPPSRLVRQEERRWLAALTAKTGRAFTLGQQFWFAWQSQGTTLELASTDARALVVALEQRYGESVHASWKLVDSGFSVTSAALTGAAPLPDPLKALIDEIAS